MVVTTRQNLHAIREFPTTKAMKDVRSFFGAASTYRMFIRRYRDITSDGFDKEIKYRWQEITTGIG